MDTKELVYRIIELIFSKKGTDVKILDLQNLTTIADYFVICSADSDTQVKAIADEVDKSLRKQGIRCYHTEGYNTFNWVLMDYFDVVVHIFKKDARNYYNLEKLWGDAQVESVEDPELSKINNNQK